MEILKLFLNKGLDKCNSMVYIVYILSSLIKDCKLSGKQIPKEKLNVKRTNSQI